MKLEGRKRSSNVEDRRGLSGGAKLGLGGGIGGIIIAVVMAIMSGGDVSQVIGNVVNAVQQSKVEKVNPKEFSEEEQKLAEECEIILGSTEEVWTKVFKDNGWGEYRLPTMVLFTNSVQSACGSATSSVGPFYCRGDEKLYIDLSFFTEMKRQLGVEGNTFAYAYVIAHEIGHHVEYLRGILTHDWSRLGETDNQISVRTELLADYYAGVWAHYEDKKYHSLEDGDIERAIELAQKIGDDWLQKQAQGRAVEESFTHGTSKQRMYWLKKGLDTGDMRTTTFNVPYRDL